MRKTFAIALLGLSCLAAASAQQVKPRFVTLPAKPGTGAVPPATLAQWAGSYVYNGKTINYTMVGANPATSNVTTTIKTFIIPVQITITKGTTKTVFDPNTVLSNGNTVIKNTTTSPVFDSTTDYVQGGVDIGAAQYLDAYQRANFWGNVSVNSNYHVTLGTPTVRPTLKLSPPASKGVTGNPFALGTRGEVDITWFDTQLNSYLTRNAASITPDTFPIFVTYNTFLTSGGCCIGGYHSATGAQTYTDFDYDSAPGSFSQDVSAFSHEVGEWYDDPFVNNVAPSLCAQHGNSLLENGDPLEGYTNYGGFAYVLHGFTYNLQDLATLPYFGAPPSTTVNGWFSFQNHTLTVCQNGG